MRVALLVTTVGLAAPAVQAQTPAPGTLWDVGVGPSVSTRPSWAYRQGSALGVGTIARVISPFRFGRIGAEWLAWFGLGDEYSRGGFPPPNVPLEPPRVRSALLNRSALSLIVMPGSSGAGTLKIGIGAARVEAIERLEVIDAESRSRQSRLVPVGSFGVSARRRVSTRFDLSPGLDLVVPLRDGGAAILLVSVLGRWARR